MQDFGLAFMPDADVYDPNDQSKEMRPMEVSIHCGSEERFRLPVRVESAEGAFSFARSISGQIRTVMDKAGPWEVRVEYAGDVIGRLPFEVELRQTGDPFDPATEA